MNLKLVVASMSILGLVSCPVFAATEAKAHNHVKMAQKVKHHRVETESRDHEREHYRREHEHEHEYHHEYHEEHEYKGMESCGNEVCAISQETMLLEYMTQNHGRAIPNPCYPDWYRRIMLAGGMNFDMGKWGSRSGNFMGENYQRISLNDVYLNLQAQVNDWVHAFASISYNTATINDPFESGRFNHVAEYDAAYDNNEISGARHTLQLEQAFATFGNFSASPVFIQIGKQFADFSRYDIHPITESMTQVMSKSLATSIKLGFIADGFTGSVYVFDDPIPKVFHSNRQTNYGGSLGFDWPSDCFGFDIGVGYMYNLIGVNDIAYAVGQFVIHNVLTDDLEGYNKRVSGLAAYADINSGPFTLGARYTTALQRFNVNDLPKHGIADLVGVVGTDDAIPFADAQGAKPWTFGATAAYGFDAWCMNQSIYIGYQTSREAAGLLLPKYRWLAGYGIDVLKWTTVAVEWDHDKAYSVSNGGTNNSYNLVTIRAAVKFG